MRLLRFIAGATGRASGAAALAGVFAGVASTGLVAVLNRLVAEPGPLAPLAAGFVALAVLMIGNLIACELLVTRLSQGAVFELRMRLCRAIVAAPLRQLETLGPARLLAVLTDDVERIAALIAIVPSIITNAAMVIASLGYLGWLSGTALLGLLALMAIGITLSQLLIGRSHRYFDLAREEHDQLYQHFRAVIEGAKELKLHGGLREAFLSRHLEPSAERYGRHRVAAENIGNLTGELASLVMLIAIGFLLFAGRFLQSIPAEVLSPFTVTIFFMTGPLVFMMSALPHVSRGAVAFAKVEGLGLLLISEAEPPRGDAPRPPLRSWKEIALRGVTYAYQEGDGDPSYTLGPVDLEVRPGSLLFVVGGNGSGKSTLAKVLTGLYPPASGEILLDGSAVTDERREAYRQRFSAVFSDFFLFDTMEGTGATDLDATARGYLELLRLDHKVKVKDGALSTTDLSQGQRKRLALLHALLTDRDVFVFDEWAADQDPEFKALFYKSILPDLRAQGKAVVVISHDDRYFDVADEIVKLEDGRIALVRPGNP